MTYERDGGAARVRRRLLPGRLGCGRALLLGRIKLLGRCAGLRCVWAGRREEGGWLGAGKREEKGREEGGPQPGICPEGWARFCFCFFIFVSSIFLYPNKKKYSQIFKTFFTQKKS